MKPFKSRAMMLAAALLACASLPNRANGETVAMKELTPTGKLRAGIVYAPALSVFFAVRDADGRPRGVTVDLADELARRLGVAADFMVAPNSGLVTDAVESGAVDVAFMPVDDERKMRVAFGPNYCLIESTYMVTGASGIRTLAEVDRPNVRVVGIANTTTIRAAGRSLKNTTITAATSVETAVELLRTGAADAFALSRDSLPPFVAQLPGSRIVDGGFQQTGIAIAVAKGRPGVLAYVSAFLEHAKASASGARSTGRDSATSRWRRPPSDGPRIGRPKRRRKTVSRNEDNAKPAARRERQRCRLAWPNENGPRGGHSLSLVTRHAGKKL